jgi:hypothetical protein
MEDLVDSTSFATKIEETSSQEIGFASVTEGVSNEAD